MNFRRSLAFACLAALATPCLCASTEDRPLNLTVPAGDAASSSSSGLPDAPGSEARVSASAGTNAGTSAGPVGVRPFSAVALAIKFGAGGVGFDVATPLAGKLNLRAGASFFSYSPSLSEDGISVNGTITFRTVGASLDYFPFGNKFRISPGLTVYNGNHLRAAASVAGGQGFTLGSVGYTSSAANPVTGTFDMAFGNKVAPSFTLGTGNMLPRKPGQHWSVPFEVGFEYIGAPTIALNLSGSACTSGQGCQPVQSTPSIEANVAQEQANLNNDISVLKVYPILSIGLSYKFGGSSRK